MENTLAAFDLALQHGCGGIEFDVRRTADGEAVICHDPRVKGLSIARFAYGGLLERVPELPTLRAVLQRYARCAYLYIELKVEGLEEQLLNALQESPPQRGYVVASFFPNILQSLHGRNREIPLGYICGQRTKLSRWRDLPVGAVMLEQRFITRDLLQQVHDAGKQVFAWTVDREARMRKLAALGVDAIVSNQTELLARTLGSGD